MVFCTLRAAGAALVLTAVIGAPAGAADRLSLGYDVYRSGFNVLAVDLDVALAPDRYDVTARYRTVGVAAWFADWRSQARSHGTIRPDGPLPQLHRVDGAFRGSRRTVEIAYRDGAVAKVAVEPPHQDDQDRDAVTDQHLAGTRDPVSSILSLVGRLGRGGACEGRFAVFDGRRRYDLIVAGRGRENIAPSGYSSFSGEATVCDVAYVPIAGHTRRRAEPIPGAPEGATSTARVWFAAVLDGAPPTPVKVEIASGWGATVVNLRGATRVAGGAAPVSLAAAQAANSASSSAKESTTASAPSSRAGTDE